jgi:predicted hydrocarbon binding protein
MVGSYFLELLKIGRVVADNGTFMFLNEHLVFLPVKTFLKLRDDLIKIIGEDKANDLLKELGKFQVAEAVKRYSKTIGIENLEKEKISEFGVNIMNLIGHGAFELKQYDEKTKTIVVRSKNSPLAIEFGMIYGKSDKYVDSYLCGIWEEAYGRLLKADLQCVETNCMAHGDEYCQFEIKPKKKN